MIKRNIHKHALQSALLFVAVLMLSVACQSENSLSDTQRIEGTTRSEELTAPTLNFTKSDQTEEAKLYSALNLGEARAVEGSLTKVFPLVLERGDQLSISAWSDLGSALFIYRPHNVKSVWIDEAKRVLSAEVKQDLQRLSIDFSAKEAGEYALVVQGQSEFTKDIVSITCLSGPCSVKSQELSEMNSAEESQEAAEQLETEISEEATE
ncbi:MAG: hypothetical protein CMH49_05165 [Myxococcales bacterium]|nr:hypothetical protein [Myxococcales bacterium]